MFWQNAEDECKKQTYEQPNPIFSSIFVANLHHSRRVFFALVKKMNLEDSLLVRLR